MSFFIFDFVSDVVSHGQLTSCPGHSAIGLAGGAGARETAGRRAGRIIAAGCGEERSGARAAMKWREDEQGGMGAVIVQHVAEADLYTIWAEVLVFCL
jgi:hypothetical protein